MTQQRPKFGFDEPLLPEMFAIHARVRAHRRAVVAHDGTHDWQGLIARTSRVANGLHGLGLRPGARVGMLMSNGIATVEVIVACLRAGYVVVPLNLSVTDANVATMLEDSGASAIVVTADQLPRVASTPIPVRIVAAGPAPAGWIGFEDWADAQSAEPPAVALTPDALAVILYSSGTTGLPKGITHSHGTRIAWARDLAAAFRYHSAANTAIATGLFSNISWVGVLCTLLNGGTLFVMDHFDPRDFMDLCERERMTHVSMVPLMFQRIIEHPQFAEFDLTSFQSMMCIGSKCPPALKAKLHALFPGALFDSYGLTEGVTTVLDPEDTLAHLESAGRPLIGTECLVLRDDDSIAGPGEGGEIVGRSRFSMVGYWNRPDANREASWIGPDGRLWLRTGDIGSIDAQGFVTILDRKKDMILSGGQNIYPADIESVLLTHDDVSECAVIGIPSDAWGETPLALVVPRNPDADAEALRAWVNARIGKQQRVHAVTFRASLPRNPNGKLLKRELRAEFWT